MTFCGFSFPNSLCHAFFDSPEKHYNPNDPENFPSFLNRCEVWTTRSRTKVWMTAGLRTCIFHQIPTDSRRFAQINADSRSLAHHLTSHNHFHRFVQKKSFFLKQHKTLRKCPTTLFLVCSRQRCTLISDSSSVHIHVRKREEFFDQVWVSEKRI